MSGHFSPNLRPPEAFEGLPGLYLAHFLDALEIEPGQQQALLGKAAIAPEALFSGRRVSLSSVLALISDVDRQALPGWHVRPALDMEAAHHGPLGVAVVSAPTIARALETLGRYEAVRAPFALLQPNCADGRWSARIIAATAADGPWPVLMEINLLALAGLIRRLLGPQARQLRLQLPRAYRPWEARLIEALPGQIDLRADDYGLSLPVGRLDQPCRLADPRLHEDAVAQCRLLVQERWQLSPLEAEIRRRLLTDITDPPTQAGMARVLGLSSRTLHRRLRENGRSYRQLLSEIRAAIAAHRLRHSHEPIARIAEQLGYQDTANFGRACRRWFGCSPGTLRHNRG